MTTQYELPVRSQSSQCERILAVLESYPGIWVPMPELARAGANTVGGFCMVHSRVAELRKRGKTILQKSHKINGVCNSFYQLQP